MKIAIVVPTNRPDRIQKFLEAWMPQWANRDDYEITVLVIEDFPQSQIEPASMHPGVHYFNHADIDRDLGEGGDCIPRFSPGVRSYGIWKAAHFRDPDMIFTTDDDCLPCGHDVIAEHWAMLETPRVLRWAAIAPDYLRGFPFSVREGTKPVLNHGLVEGVPDIDAITQLLNPHLTHTATGDNEMIPWGSYFTLSIQNVAFRSELAPIMYLPMLEGGMKRWSDIWCGLIMKKICDTFEWPVCSGFPCVLHERASNVWNNLKEEVWGYEINERLWKIIDGIELKCTDILDCYRRIAWRLMSEMPELKTMAKSMLDWANLW